jgi:cytosine/adenosine deaminase-related metal-dependent hydrolase
MRFIKASQIFDGEKFLDPSPVLVFEKNVLSDVISGDGVDPLKVETLEGIITPGFVNAHCHLELSHLKGRIPQHTGLPSFGKQIISIRNQFKKEEILEHIAAADKQMQASGIVAVGDICNGSDSFKIKAGSKILYHSFVELLGLHPAFAENIFQSGLQLMSDLKNYALPGSLAPHAPYSTSLELIQKISNYNISHDLPSSIHNQESEEENKFLNGEKGGFDDLYSFLNLDISWFQAPQLSSILYYMPSLRTQQTLLVHNAFTQKEDISFVRGQNIFWCFCPNANIYIGNRLPNYDLFSGEENICLGTDSLASNHRLDLVSEANLLLLNSDYSPEKVLAAMTSVPASFLGLSDRFGFLLKGKDPGINLIELKNRQIKFLKKIL